MKLDHLAPIELTETQAQEYRNELFTLRRLRYGLEFLNRLVDERQRCYREAERQWRASGEDFGKLTEYEGDLNGLQPLSEIECVFHWYAVSACNYALLVGWLGSGQDTKKANCYMKQVLGPAAL